MLDQLAVDLDRVQECAVEAKEAVVEIAVSYKEAILKKWDGISVSFEETEESLAEKARDIANEKVMDLQYRKALRELKAADASWY